MTKIEIPTYKILKDNQIYFKDGPALNGAYTSQMICLARFKAPSLEGVLDAINTGARISIQRRTNPSIKSNSFIDELLEKADLDYVTRISKRDSKILDHLKDHIHKEAYQPDQRYLFLKSSCLPRELMASAEESVQQITRIPSHEVGIVLPIILSNLIGISNTIGENKWIMSLKLDENWGLPNINDVLTLLKYETKDSSILNVSGEYRNYSEVKRHLIYLNEAINNGDILEIEDNTTRLIDESAYMTLKTTLGCMAAQKVAGSLIETIQEGLPNNKFEIKFPMRKKGNDDPCLN